MLKFLSQCKGDSDKRLSTSAYPQKEPECYSSSNLALSLALSRERAGQCRIRAFKVYNYSLPTLGCESTGAKNGRRNMCFAKTDPFHYKLERIRIFLCMKSILTF